MPGMTPSFPTPTICEDSESPARTPATARTPSTASATWPWIWLARYQDSGRGMAAGMSERCERYTSHAIAGFPETTAGCTRLTISRDLAHYNWHSRSQHGRKPDNYSFVSCSRRMSACPQC